MMRPLPRLLLLATIAMPMVSAAEKLSIHAKAGKENPDGGHWPGQLSHVGPAWQLLMPL